MNHGGAPLLGWDVLCLVVGLATSFAVFAGYAIYAGISGKQKFKRHEEMPLND